MSDEPKKKLKDILQTCEHCGKQFSMRGLPRHRQACARDRGADGEVNPPEQITAPETEKTTTNETLTKTLPTITIPALIEKTTTEELIQNTGSEIIETAAGNQIEIVRSAAVAAPSAKPAGLAAIKELSATDAMQLLQDEHVRGALEVFNRLGNAIADRIEAGTAKKQQSGNDTTRPNEVNF